MGSYISPLSQLASGVESLGAVQSITAYLSDNTQLIANPGLRLGVRTDATALYQISDFWKKQHENSDLSKYIIRRYLGCMTFIDLKLCTGVCYHDLDLPVSSNCLKLLKWIVF